MPSATNHQSRRGHHGGHHHHHRRRRESKNPVTLRGEICIGSASVLCAIAIILLIFAHLGQVNTTTIPRGIAMMKVNMTNYGLALQNAIGDPVEDLYTTNASAPVGQQAGLRNLYQHGLYSYCAYVDHAQGTCSNKSAAFQLQPFSDILADMSPRFSGITRGFIPGDLTFTNSHYLGEFSKAAYYLLLMGSICAVLALPLGLRRNTFMYFASSLFVIFGTSLLFIGVVIWTVLIHKVQSINHAKLKQTGAATATIPLGIFVSVGSQLWLFWAAFVCLLLSSIPYVISCCTFRG